jgi:NAD+ synthase
LNPAIQMLEAVREADGWTFARGPLAKLPDDLEADWRACVMGLGDYVNKNGFPGVVLGLSGGIDSAICAAMAVDALGRPRPLRDDALRIHRAALAGGCEACAKALGRALRCGGNPQARGRLSGCSGPPV